MDLKDIEAIKKLAVIDWPKCLNFSTNQTNVFNLINLLAKDLKQQAEVLDTSYVQQDVKKMAYTLDYMISGVCYIKLPQLEHALRACYQVIIKYPLSQTHLDIAYDILKTAIKNFNLFWKSYSAKSSTYKWQNLWQKNGNRESC